MPPQPDRLSSSRNRSCLAYERVLLFAQRIGAAIDMASVPLQVNIAPVRSRNHGVRTT
jgi:hypothetical protein